ncbi:MAG TPA: MiaB/RimO family radical SAM methylthiotransferase [Terriglobales bacterium]|nr:MiaB/RimO family radical SAM methylthiotransferase [Terriglobales bacterium]
MGTFYIENFGCRATQADGAALESQFQSQGLQRADAMDAAQVVVLNTCTVTAAADQDARAAIRRVSRKNPGARIVVTGCYAQRAPAEVAAIPGVSLVVGNSHKHELASIAVNAPGFVPVEKLVVGTGSRLQAAGFSETSILRTTPDQRSANDLLSTTDEQRPTTEIFVSDIFAHTELLAAPVFDAAGERTRPNLKVQDGCDNRCSFCVIPFVRGSSRSLPMERVVAEARTLVEAGYKELVISGINLGRWGRDLRGGLQASGSRLQQSKLKKSGSKLQESGSRSQASDARKNANMLTALIRAILDQTSLEKLRVSSVEPMDWSEELIRLMASSARIAKHAHVPMQSGSDAVLRRMHRKYRPWHYREKILAIRKAMPTAAIGADVMVGFPGETDAEFEETRRMVEELPFTYLHVFTYSARPGTPAAEMKSPISVRVAKERNRILRDLAAQKKLEFMRSFIGKTVDVITLKQEAKCHEDQDGCLTIGLTDNYLKMQLREAHPPNQWIAATVESVVGGELVGS